MLMIYINEYYIYLREKKPFFKGEYDKIGTGRLPQLLQVQYFVDTGDIIDDKYYGDTYSQGMEDGAPDEDDYREMIMDNLSYVYSKIYKVESVGDEDYEEWFDIHFKPKEYGLQESSYDDAPPLNGWDVSKMNDNLFKTDNRVRAAISSSYIITYNNEEDDYICNSAYMNDLNTYGYPDNIQAISDGRETWRDNILIRFKQFPDGDIKVADYFTRPTTIEDYRQRLIYYLSNYADELFYVVNDEDDYKWWKDDDALSQPFNNGHYQSDSFVEWFKITYPDRNIKHLDRDDWMDEVMTYQMDFDTMYLGLPQYGNAFFYWMDRLFKEQGDGATVETPLGLVRVYEFEPDDPFDYGNTYVFTPDKAYTLEEDVIDLDILSYVEEGNKDNTEQMNYTNDDFNWLNYKEIKKDSNFQSQKNLKMHNFKPEAHTDQIILEEGSTFRKGISYCLSKEGLFCEGKENLSLKRIRYDEHLSGHDDGDKGWYHYYYPDDIGFTVNTSDLRNVEYLKSEDFK